MSLEWHLAARKTPQAQAMAGLAERIRNDLPPAQRDKHRIGAVTVRESDDVADAPQSEWGVWINVDDMHINEYLVQTWDEWRRIKRFVTEP